MRFTGFIGFLCAILCLSSTASATSRVWTGNSTLNSDWNNGANWSGGVAPVAGDDLEFPSDGLHPNCTDNYTNGTTFNSIIFTNGGAGSPKLFNLMGNSIALNAGIRVLNAGVVPWPNTMTNGLVLNSNQTFATGPFTSLTLAGAINLNGKELTFDTAASSPIDAHTVLSGIGNLIKTNPGTLTLYSNNTYTGSTTVSGGTLALNGSIGAIPNSTNIAVSGSSAVFNAGTAFTLRSGQTLSGIGSIAGNVIVASGGILSPGNNGVGTLTLSNFLTLNATSTFVAVLNGTNAATGYSQVYAQSGVSLLNPVLSLTLGYTPAVGDRFMLITNGGGGAVNGTFSGLPEGAFFTNNGVGFRITYAGGDGNDVVLTRIPPPIPPLVVTSAADSGPGSLRATLALATNGNTIVFATNVVGAIKLTTGELLLNQSVNILGPGPAVLAVDGNSSNRVFHVTNGVTAFISGLTVTNGTGSTVGNIGGGGIWNDHSTLTLSNCSVTYSSGGNGAGGGIYNDGDAGSANLSIIASTISHNYCLNNIGGGLMNDGSSGGSATASIIASTFNNNSANGNANGGGAIFNDGNSGSAMLSASNCTLVGNYSLNYYGGGIFNSGASGAGTVAVIACTMAGNSAVTGGDNIFNNGSGGKVELGGSISLGALHPDLANNGGPFISDGYNLSSYTGGGLLTNSTDRTLANPLLGPLTDNGGLTHTCALAWGSPAIDKGKRFGLATDQRGVSGSYDFSSLTNASGGDGSDIGAFELIPSVQFTSIDVLTNHSVQLQGAGFSNLTYTVQAATNLNPIITWTNLGTATASNTGAFSFTDTNASSFPDRYYRAMLPP